MKFELKTDGNVSGAGTEVLLDGKPLLAQSVIINISAQKVITVDIEYFVLGTSPTDQNVKTLTLYGLDPRLTPAQDDEGRISLSLEIENQFPAISLKP